MTTVRQMLEYAWAAQGSYSFVVPEAWGQSQLARDLAIGRLQIPEIGSGQILASPHAERFINGTTFPTVHPDLPSHYVVHQQPNTESGFSGTVFRNMVTGEYVLALRGTEAVIGQAWQDVIIADVLGITAHGNARDQAIDAYRYYKRLTSPAGAPVQYSAQELDMLALLLAGPGNPLEPWILDSVTETVSLDEGLGLIESSSDLVFTGHSLGGHLALALGSMMAPGAVDHVYTFNAPGVLGANAQILDWLGLEGSVPSSLVSNIVSEEAAEVTAGLGVVFGNTGYVFVEYAGLLDSISTHFMSRLSDFHRADGGARDPRSRPHRRASQSVAAHGFRPRHAQPRNRARSPSRSVHRQPDPHARRRQRSGCGRPQLLAHPLSA